MSVLKLFNKLENVSVWRVKMVLNASSDFSYQNNLSRDIFGSHYMYVYENSSIPLDSHILYHCWQSNSL